MPKMPVPLRLQVNRLPEQGLIKYGIKDETRKGAPKAIEWFRFCSGDLHAIRTLAGLYGGTVQPWKNGYGRPQWQVTSATSTLRVVLPPDPLGDGPIYERWKGGGCERRCDGETCTIPRGMSMSDPNPEPTEVDCLCAAEDALSCKPHTRLKVVLPELTPFMGCWRLEAKGQKASEELPGMCAVVLEAQGRGMAHGLLRLEQRSEYGWNDAKGKRELHHYVTPVVGPSVSFDALLAGDGRARALAPAGGPLALDPAPYTGSDSRDWTTPLIEGATPEEIDAIDRAHFESDIEDAEVVEDVLSGLGQPSSAQAVATEGDLWEQEDAEIRAVESEMERLQRDITWKLLNDTPLRHALVRRMTKGRTESTKDLGLEEMRLLKLTGERIQRGELRPVLVDGEVQWERETT